MKLYKTRRGILLQSGDDFFEIESDWDTLINRDELHDYLTGVSKQSTGINADKVTGFLSSKELLPPISNQEVWAAGVTYLKSRDARMEESETAASLYDMVYDAERPELFFKALPHRVAGHWQEVFIRKDSTWNVPEPELTLFINKNGNIQGYTCGNDMSSRSIEGENALYLPQAKIYEKSAALGPCLYIPSAPVSPETAIRMNIKRAGSKVFEDFTTVARIKRPFTGLAAYLFRECDFPNGCFLMTGTCLVPPPDFTLAEGDIVEISIDGIGTLVNTIGINPKHKSN